MENFELYLIVIFIVILIGFILNTIKYYRGEKRKVKNLHRFAKEGETDAQHHLAEHYEKGDMVKQDAQKAAFWKQRASFSAYRSGKGTLQNRVKTKTNQKK